MSSCPNFSCLRYTVDGCVQYPSCDTCPSHYDCSLCGNQTEVVDSTAVPCDLRQLPEPCRFCARREEDTFTTAICDKCPSGGLKAAYLAHSSPLSKVQRSPE